VSKEGLVDDFEAVYLKLPPEKIVELKFILETYEGLGELRTLSNMTGEVAVLTTGGQREVLSELLESLSEGLGMREIPKPDSLKGDWLLGEHQQEKA